VVGLSRRGGPVRHVAADLLDPQRTRDALTGLPGITHHFYAAYQDRPTRAASSGPN
jgi:hypothetical protein